MYYSNMREEEVKNKIAQAYFPTLDCTTIIGNIDFCVKPPLNHNQQLLLTEHPAFLWAEAKRNQADLVAALVQLILTIGKAKTFNKHLPPPFLAAFDAEKIAFILYSDIHEVFYQNDFNWNVAPSNHNTREFRQVYDNVKTTLEQTALTFYFGKDDVQLNSFISQNFSLGQVATSKLRIDKNNFTVIYAKWLEAVKPTIAVNWAKAKKQGIIDGDFYIADLLSRDNHTLKEKLWVLLKRDHYELDRKINDLGLFTSSRTSFKDKQQAHRQFWNKYDRPPGEEYWDYIVKRRDLLVPQDMRERKGSFFTPKVWVELSQQYIADVLGEDWQDDYFIWDCAAGTGNLLAGLTNKYQIYASTLDQQDVDIMHDRIKNGANLLESHVFQFDFLNDPFDKLPESLRDIIDDPLQRKKLLVYINPPYAEAGSGILKAGTKTSVNRTHVRAVYKDFLQKANHELYAQFLARIYNEIAGCQIAEFSTLKILQGHNSAHFRNNFLAKLQKIFICPADTFDNVKGQFPIGFKIWDTSQKVKFSQITSDAYDKNGHFFARKTLYSYDDAKGKLNIWIKSIDHKSNGLKIGEVGVARNDVQSKRLCYIGNTADRGLPITADTLLVDCIFYTVQKVIKATWLNDRDQFLYPNAGWKEDIEFQNDCLAYTLFSDQNRIRSEAGLNYWIPFTESEVNAQERFKSHFMTVFIAGKLKQKESNGLHDNRTKPRSKPLIFSALARAVFDSGKALWTYYHKQPNCKVNASLYEIKEHFQGRNQSGRLNRRSSNKQYNKLIDALRTQLKQLAFKIQPKVYEYEFLKS